MNALLFSVRVGLALVLTVPILAFLTVAVPSTRMHHLTQRWARWMVTLCGCRPHVIGHEHLPGDRTVVFTANHASFFDSVVLLAALPGPYRFVVNHQAAARPLLGTIIRKAGHLVVDRRSLRSRAACARAIERTLASGHSLLLFPEGTRGRDGLLTFRLGGFRAAIRASRAVVPVALSGTQRMFPRDARLPQPTPLTVQVLPPVRTAGCELRQAAGLRDEVQAAIAGALAAERA